MQFKSLLLILDGSYDRTQICHMFGIEVKTNRVISLSHFDKKRMHVKINVEVKSFHAPLFIASFRVLNPFSFHV